jgi:hypothetical protein
MDLSLRLSFYLRRGLGGLHGGPHHGIPSRDRGGCGLAISPLNPIEVTSSGHLLNEGLGGYCWGNIPRVPRVPSYGPKTLDTISSLQQ